VRVAFVYPNPREELARQVAAGKAPDTALLGQNHLAGFGIESFVYDSALRRVHATHGLAHRATWIAREATLPWELRSADIVVTPLVNLLPLFARLQRRPRVLVVSYGTASLWARASRPRRALLRASLKAAAGIVTISEAGRDRLIRDIGVDASRVQSVPFGIDEAFWRAAPPASQGHVLTVGRDLARDYETFAEALDGLPVRAVVVAKDENLRGVRLPPNVEVRAHIPLEELRQLYADAACVVVPMVRDGDPRGTESSGNTALLEAMACGRATVVTERASLREYIYADATVTTPPQDPVALKAAIERLMDGPEETAAMGAAARRHVVERHTTTHFAELLSGIITQVGAR
jgi:glycosyltransferase involved in cell wall biosynthesis